MSTQTAAKLTPLVSPDESQEWTPATPTERTNLIARGWRPKGEKKPAPAKS